MKILAFITIIALLSLVLTKKKKKSKQAYVYDPLDHKPEQYTYEYWCEVCKDTVKELTKRTYNKRTESYVYDILDNMCNPELYKQEGR
jgi:hypothetical protein